MYPSPSIQLAQDVEKFVRDALIGIRKGNPTNYSVPILRLYTAFSELRGGITSGFFAKIIADMRRTGIVLITKNNEVLLTNAAWEMEQRKADVGSAS